MSGITQGLLATTGASAPPPPPIPAFSNIALCASLFNWNNAGYPAGVGVNYENAETDPNDLLFTGVAPYPADWASIAGTAPYLASLWADQNGNANDLVQTGATRPIFDVANRKIASDGTQWLTSTLPIFSPAQETATFYVLFQATDLVGTGYLFAIGRDSVNDGAITAKMVAGVLTVTVTTTTTHLPNTKIKTIADGNWHLLTIVIDVNVTSDTRDQVLMLIDNSAADVTSPLAADLAGSTLNSGIEMTIAARNAAGVLPIGNTMRLARIQTNADDVTAQTAMWTYAQYLQTLLP